MNTKKTISILGSTGSIGTQTLDIVRLFPDQYSVIGLSGHRNITLIKEQIKEFTPSLISVSKEEDARILRNWIKTESITCEITHGPEGLSQIAKLEQDLIVIAIVGTSGIKATYDAIQQKTPIGLACKEVLVSAGDIIMPLAKSLNCPIIPIDSEHAAVKQCLESPTYTPDNIHQIILTASGGPFWELPKEQFKDLQVEQALKHPNWTMGQKITIDSATMVNKGLEIIEAHHLFDIPYNKLDILVHRQSIVHGIVEFIDGNILAHLSPTDMHFPIQYALTYPNRQPTQFKRLSFADCKTLTFDPPDYERFPLLKLALDCGKEKGSYPVVFNAANEAAVQLCLNKEIPFYDLFSVVNKTVERFNHRHNLNIEDTVEIDQDIKNGILSITR